MLPSRGIVRSLGATRTISTRTLVNGRNFATLRYGSGLTATTLKTRASATPAVALGTVASTRSLSLWGWGSKKSADKPTDLPTETVIPDQTPSEAAEAAAEALRSTATSQSPAALQTTTAATPADAISATTTTATTTPATDLAEISDLVNSGSEILSRQEGLGYLSSLGLDYGWGFTSIMQWTLEHVQYYTGFGWAGAIVTTAILMRVAMFYPQVRATKFSMDMKRMQEDPRHVEVMANIQKAIRNGDRVAQQQAQLLNNILRKEYDVPFTRMGWSFLPIPFSIGLFRIINGMASIPVPSLETAGFLWFQDLTVSDPYMILPAMATGIMVLSMEMNSANSTAQQKAMIKKMKFVLVPLMLIGTSFLSAGVNLMGAALAFATLCTQALLHNPTIRQNLGIPAIVPPPPPVVPIYEAPRQPESIREKLTTGLDDVKKGLSESMEKFGGTFRGTEKDQAEKRRRDLIRKLDEKRNEQERQHFEEKYKSKR